MGDRFELNAKSFRDGQIVLYQRPDHKKPRWQCRLHIPGRTGYLIFSTKTHDEFEARKFAEDKLDELRIKHLAKESLKSKKVSQAVRLYLKHINTTVSDRRRQEEIRLAIDHYVNKFFDGKNLDVITPGSVNQFAAWRLQNFQRKRPNSNYLRKDIGAFRRFHEWCVDQGWCKEIRTWKLPKAEQNRRPHFTANEYRQLIRHLRPWVAEGKTREGGNKYRERFVLQHYILILANTGLRVGEARTLKWRDCHEQVRKTGDKEHRDTILSVRGKTGKRDVVAAQDTVRESLTALWNLRTQELSGSAADVGEQVQPKPDDFVFVNRAGKQIGSFKKGFQSLLQSAELEMSSDGERRTIYSLRHTYATFRLDQGVSINDLRLNMGTSTKMIEQHYYHALNRRRAAELRLMKNEHRSAEPMVGSPPWTKLT